MVVIALVILSLLLLLAQPRQVRAGLVAWIPGLFVLALSIILWVGGYLHL